MTPMRVVTYNISGAQHADAVVAVLAALRPDIACLTETPGRLALRRLARRAGLDVVARAGRRGAGTAILVGERARRLSDMSEELPSPAGAPRRMLAQAIVTAGGLRLSVFAVQLGLRPDVRAAHAQTIIERCARFEMPLVVAGDLNESPDGTAVRTLAARLDDAWELAGDGPGATVPNPDPSARTDYVFVSADLVVERATVYGEPPTEVASHHRPVVVDLAHPEAEPTAASRHVDTGDDTFSEPAA